MAPSAQTEPAKFESRLPFNPSKLSTGILKRYLNELLQNIDVDKMLAATEIPEKYVQNPIWATNFKVTRDLAIMSVNEWKQRLQKENNVESLYLDDDDEMMQRDSAYYFECFKTVQDEVGSFEKQMEFFRLVSEIVRDLSSRAFVEISYEGGMKSHELGSGAAPPNGALALQSNSVQESQMKGDCIPLVPIQKSSEEQYMLQMDAVDIPMKPIENGWTNGFSEQKKQDYGSDVQVDVEEETTLDLFD